MVTTRLDLADLIDLRLQVGDDFTRHLIAEQLEQIDALAAGDGLEGGHLNALLHALDLGVLRDQLLGLGLPDGFIGQGATIALGRGHGQGNEGEQADSNLHGSISGTDERVIHAALQRREHLGRIRDQLDELVDRNGLIKRDVLELVDERDGHRSGQQGLVRPDVAPLQGDLVHMVPVLLDVVLWPGQADGHHGKQAKGNLHRLWDTHGLLGINVLIGLLQTANVAVVYSLPEE
uniref:Uncharacterized protein n=1 Tax=Anopheles coluzzii TaxID=1518534 RepID=A0A8W7PFI4_ANOCL